MTPLATAAVHPQHSRDSPHTTVRHSRTTPMPFSPSHSHPFSAGQPLPPSSKLDARSPLATAHVRTPSPNYFGLTVDPAADYTSSGAVNHARKNWSPPTSNVRSTAVASPRVVPLDQNPDLQAFRKQTEAFGFPSARLSGFSMVHPPVGRATNKSRHANAETAVSPLGPSFTPTSPPPPTVSTATPLSPNQRSPKRLLESDESPLTDRPRRNSPAGFNDREITYSPAHLTSPDRPVRASLPTTQSGFKPPSVQPRAQTLSASHERGAPGDGKDSPVMKTPQHVVNLLKDFNDDILLLDVRVASQYAQSRIIGALSLCIPPLLLKRPAYNLTRLAENFNHDPEQKQRFERWQSCQYIVIYDRDSAHMKDAAACLNVFDKFVKQGWSGFQYIVQGGFAEFSKRFPDFITHGGSSSESDSKIAPVVGGCDIPAATTKTAANPFFGNIRQNMDLIGGVGQMDLAQPANFSNQQREDMPNWLQKASNPDDRGKDVSDKFLHIEKREQRRMQDALSGTVQYGAPTDSSKMKVQLAGIEKGSKNRYNNIWPFEHSRVKLEGVSKGGCDYVNANYLQATGSNKRYIATQSPVPATFADFWNVVWQQDVRVILMLTAEQEGGQIKAHNYWSDKRYGPFLLSPLAAEKRASLEPSRISKHRQASSKNAYARPGLPIRRSTAASVNELMPKKTPREVRSNPFDSIVVEPVVKETKEVKDESPYVIVRRFMLIHTAQPFAPPREVTQLQYTNWPDFGAPAHPAHLLGLVEQTDAVVRASYGPTDAAANPDLPESKSHGRPVIVHCSAGCGRTGTFCTVDSVIDMLKRELVERKAKGDEQMQGDDDSTTSNSEDDTDPMDTDNPSAADNVSQLPRHDIDLIEQTVEEFRHQRISSVQSLRQYVLCYESVLEWLAERESGSSHAVTAAKVVAVINGAETEEA